MTDHRAEWEEREGAVIDMRALTSDSGFNELIIHLKPVLTQH